MSAVADIVEKRITKTATGIASSMLEKLKKDKKDNNIQVTTFPHNLENQAQSTYMVIYVFDNESNQQKFSTNIFESSEDEDSYEIGAITYVKDLIKNEVLDPIKNTLKAQGDYLVKTGKDWLNKQKEALKKETTDSTNSLTIGGVSVKEAGDWLNKWVIPHRKQSGSKKLNDFLDPVKNPGSGWKLKHAVQIQMPTSDITNTYENGWESVDTHNLANIRRVIEGAGDMINSVFGKEKGGWSGGLKKMAPVGEQIKNAVGDLITGGGYSADRYAATRKVLNPILVFNYKVPSPRTFTYSFQLYPRNKEELYTLFNMIQMLKFYSLPATGQDGKYHGSTPYFTYPATFAVKFYTNGKENKWMPKTMRMGLTRISETLTGENGDMAFFENYFDKNSGNPPRIVNLTLEFKELGIMSREYANLGY